LWSNATGVAVELGRSWCARCECADSRAFWLQRQYSNVHHKHLCAEAGDTTGSTPDSATNCCSLAATYWLLVQQVISSTSGRFARTSREVDATSGGFEGRLPKAA
ncbi:unnamed protein product, partial [Pylaiella littoralis]